MWKSLRTTEEAERDATITEEVVAVNAEAQADLEEEVLPEEASDQEKKVDSEAIEIPLQEQNVQIDREEKADLIATVLQKKHQVIFKEKAAHQDVQKVQLINQQAVHLRLLKAEGRGSSRQFQFSVCIS
jgi:hypothetical protein